ncbi:MAG: hypothetical protein AAFQ54_14440 [Pseudomonadota bacterium]
MTDELYLVLLIGLLGLVAAIVAFSVIRGRNLPHTNERIAEQQRVSVENQQKILAAQMDALEVQRAQLAAAERQAAALERIADAKS